MYINDFLKNYRGNKYLKSGFKNWCNSNNIPLKQEEKEWIDIFECDYSQSRKRTIIVNKSMETNPVKIETKINIDKKKRGNK